MDDNYTTIEAGHDATGWRYGAARRGQDVQSIEAHMRVASFADAVIVSTPYLHGLYSRLNKNVHLCPNSVDPDDWPEPPDRSGREVIRVGFAGSASHKPDLALAARALAWAAEQPGVEVVMIGLDPGWRFPYRYVPWTEEANPLAGVRMAEYRSNLGELDIGLVPLRETLWSRGKSDLKILEYAMAGVAPVVSDAVPFHGWRSTLALHKTNHEMLAEVKRLVGSARAREEIVAAVRERIHAERTIERTVPLWSQAIAGEST